jgi:FkbM family methyltransferase
MTAPPGLLRPLRQAVADGRRGSLRRNAALAVLRQMKPWFRVSELPEIRPLDMPELSFEPTDSMVIDAVFWFGMRAYEGQMYRIWPALCASARSVLEVGGNIGFYSVLGGRAVRGNYLVVEPVPEIARVLTRNLARNKATQVEVLEAAVVTGHAEQTVTLNIPDADRAAPVAAHLAVGTEVVREVGRSLQVRGVPFRSLAMGRDLVKIDAEGIEAALLADAVDVLDATRPVLTLEVLPEAPRLAALVRDIAARWNRTIVIVPEYGMDGVLYRSAENFDAAEMPRFHAKDVVLVSDRAVIEAAIGG